MGLQHSLFTRVAPGSPARFGKRRAAIGAQLWNATFYHDMTLENHRPMPHPAGVEPLSTIMMQDKRYFLSALEAACLMPVYALVDAKGLTIFT